MIIDETGSPDSTEDAMAGAVRIAVIGLGKIAVDQHLPAIAASPGFTLVATVDPRPANTAAPSVPNFPSFDALLDAGIAVDAVAICTPPQVRAAIARRALDAGLSVLLEKPPTATLEEFATLKRHAHSGERTLFTAWHSRFAPMVDAARIWLSGRIVSGGRIDWREDVRRWHPGQHWLWQPGGMGVFDPGINAFSILTAILPVAPLMHWAALDIPENLHTPIRARAWLAAGSAAIGVTLDFLEVNSPAWDIVLETSCGHMLRLSDGGATLAIDDEPPRSAPSDEYPALYAHFAALLAARASDADALPMALALEALAIGTVQRVDAFIE